MQTVFNGNLQSFIDFGNKVRKRAEAKNDTSGRSHGRQSRLGAARDDDDEDEDDEEGDSDDQDSDDAGVVVNIVSACRPPPPPLKSPQLAAVESWLPRFCRHLRQPLP